MFNSIRATRIFRFQLWQILPLPLPPVGGKHKATNYMNELQLSHEDWFGNSNFPLAMRAYPHRAPLRRPSVSQQRSKS